MTQRTRSKPVNRKPTRAQVQRLTHRRRQIAHELPELIAGDQARKEASDEQSLSGDLRRAIHASELSLNQIAERIGVTPMMLDEFLTGERTLRSDVMDRLARVLGCTLRQTA